MLLRSFAFAALGNLVLLTACGGGGNYRRSINGTDGGYSFKNVKASVPSVMVAHKIDRPLYLVLDPAKLKDRWEMSTTACETKSAGCEHFAIFDVQEFVKRDLQNAFSQYFTKVEVVAPGAIPTTPSIVGDVKIDDLRLHDEVAGMLTYTHIEMNWGLALRRSEDTDYSYSFAGVATTPGSYPTFEAGLGQMVENAITTMMKKLVEEGGMKRLDGSDAEPPPAVRAVTLR